MNIPNIRNGTIPRNLSAYFMEYSFPEIIILNLRNTVKLVNSGHWPKVAVIDRCGRNLEVVAVI